MCKSLETDSFHCIIDFKPVSCPVCHKEFSRKYHLVRHNMQTGCDGSERPTFPCQVSYGFALNLPQLLVINSPLNIAGLHASLHS